MINRAVFILLHVLLLAWALYRLGWLTPPRPWEEATGWNRIPAEQLPLNAAHGAATTPDTPCSSASVRRISSPGEFTLDWLGHSGFILRWAGQTILLDPNTSTRCTVARRLMELPANRAAVDHADAVLISHAHYDHLNLDTLQRVMQIGFTAIPESSEVYFGEAADHAKPRPVRVGDSISLGPLEIFPVPAAHNGNRFHPWRSPKPAVGYIIRSPTCTLYFAGDTAFHNDFASIRAKFHPDIAILPIGAYAPRYPLKIHHMNPEEAVQAAKLLGVKTVIPCHFGTFNLTFDHPAAALPRFAAVAWKEKVDWLMPTLAQEPAAHGAATTPVPLCSSASARRILDHSL